jgi:acyl-CoA synthetase (AMP-forming)/AMP-acid ligase II
MALRGMMMEQPLLISSLIDYAAAQYGDVEIVSRSVEGPIHRTTYADAARRSRQLAQALLDLGIAPGDRVATLAWPTGISSSTTASRAWAGSATPSTRACSATRSSTSSITPPTGSSSRI